MAKHVKEELISISEAARRIKQQGINISSRTLHRAIQRAGIESKKVGSSFGITMSQAMNAYRNHSLEGKRSVKQAV